MPLLLYIAVIPYSLLITLLWLNLRKGRQRADKGNKALPISVVVACRNEEDNIPVLIPSLLNQQIDSCTVEIIVVDDNSNDLTLSLLKDMQGVNPDLIILSSDGNGKKAALMKGILEARGELIVLTDADTIHTPQWLSSISEFQSTSGADMIIAPVALFGPPSFITSFQIQEFLALQGVTAGTALAGYPIMCNGANLAFRKSIYLNNLHNLKPDVASGDDIFLLHAALKNPENSIRWLEKREAIVRAQTPEKFRMAFRQKQRWISKTGSYDNKTSLFVGLCTLIANIAIPVAFIISFWHPTLFLHGVIILLLKIIPDYLLIANRGLFSNQRPLLISYLLSAMLYPLWAMAMLPSLFIKRENLSWK